MLHPSSRSAPKLRSPSPAHVSASPLPSRFLRGDPPRDERVAAPFSHSARCAWNCAWRRAACQEHARARARVRARRQRRRERERERERGARARLGEQHERFVERGHSPLFGRRVTSGARRRRAARRAGRGRRAACGWRASLPPPFASFRPFMTALAGSDALSTGFSSPESSSGETAPCHEHSRRRHIEVTRMSRPHSSSIESKNCSKKRAKVA